MKKLFLSLLAGLFVLSGTSLFAQSDATLFNSRGMRLTGPQVHKFKSHILNGRVRICEYKKLVALQNL